MPGLWQPLALSLGLLATGCGGVLYERLELELAELRQQTRERAAAYQTLQHECLPGLVGGGGLAYREERGGPMRNDERWQTHRGRGSKGMKKGKPRGGKGRM